MLPVHIVHSSVFLVCYVSICRRLSFISKCACILVVSNVQFWFTSLALFGTRQCKSKWTESEQKCHKHSNSVWKLDTKLPQLLCLVWLAVFLFLVVYRKVLASTCSWWSALSRSRQPKDLWTVWQRKLCTHSARTGCCGRLRTSAPWYTHTSTHTLFRSQGICTWADYLCPNEVISCLIVYLLHTNGITTKPCVIHLGFALCQYITSLVSCAFTCRRHN